MCCTELLGWQFRPAQHNPLDPPEVNNAPNPLCWHISHLWPACLAESSHLDLCPALGLLRSSKAGLGGAVPWLESEADAVLQLVFLLLFRAHS